MANKNSNVSIVSLAGGGDCDTELMERGERSKVTRWSRKLLDISFTLVAMDVFQPNRHTEHDPFVRLTQDRPHWLSRWWVKLFNPICAYLVVRPLLSFTLRFLIDHLNSSRDLSSPTESHSVQTLRWLLDLNGDPACSVDKLTPVSYLGSPIEIGVLVCALPYYLRNIRPFDCSLVRLLLDPKREIRRIDRSTSEKLNFALERVEKQRKELSGQLGMSPRFRTVYRCRASMYDCEHLQATLVRLMEQSTLLRHFRHNLQALRPPTFKADWLQYYHRAFFILYLSSLAFYLMIFSTIMYFMFFIGKQGRCYSKMSSEHNLHLIQWVTSNTEANPTDCKVFSMFTLAECLMFFEICATYQTIVLISFTFFITLILIVVSNQLDTTKCMSESLSRLLAELRQVSMRMEKKSQLLPGREGEERALTLGCIDSSMYENIIGLWTYEAESRKSLAQVEILLTFYMTMAALLALASFGSFIPSISGSSVGCKAGESLVYKQSDFMGDLAEIVAILIPSLVWTCANVVMLLCALIPSRVVSMKRLVVSISAQLIQISHSEHSLSARRNQSATTRLHRKKSLRLEAIERDMNANNPLLLLWRKIVLSRNFELENHSVNMFDFKLTYGKVLELNFYIIALVSLLGTRH